MISEAKMYISQEQYEKTMMRKLEQKANPCVMHPALFIFMIR